jgi:hypothetical protein
MSRTSLTPCESSPSPTFTLDELMSAFRQDAANVVGWSVSDMVAQTGMPRDRVNKWLREAVPAGRVKCSGRVLRPAVDGTMRPVPVYVPVRAA